jgi:hypothetical protein
MTHQDTARTDYLPVVSDDEYRERTAKPAEVKGYLVPGYLAA